MSTEENAANTIQDSTDSDNKELKPPETKLPNRPDLRSMLVAECGFKITSTEHHLKRLQILRKEINFINETDWMFDINDKLLPS